MLVHLNPVHWTVTVRDGMEGGSNDGFARLNTVLARRTAAS